MKRIIVFVILLMVPSWILSGQTVKLESDWSGMWTIQYYSINNEGWVSIRFEMNADGQVNYNDEYAGEWKIEKIKVEKFPLEVRILRICANFGEFFVMYNYPEKQHTGIGFIVEPGQVIPVNIEFHLYMNYKFY